MVTKYQLLNSYLLQNSMLPTPPAPRRHSLDGHESPINPGSPLLDEDSSEDQYKFRPPPIGSMGISPGFNSFSGPPHQSPPLPSLGNAMGYPSPSPLCPTPMYNSPDACSAGRHYSLGPTYKRLNSHSFRYILFIYIIVSMLHGNLNITHFKPFYFFTKTKRTCNCTLISHIS